MEMIWITIFWLACAIFSYGYINGFFIGEWGSPYRPTAFIFSLAGPLMVWYILGADIHKGYKWTL